MGSSESETEPKSTTQQLQLTSLPYLKSTQFSGTLTPLTPLHTSASVPFKWEQEPGKPLPCLTLALPTNNANIMKCLELPPRLLYETKFTKPPSPTTVLDGPDITLGRSILGSSSFRFLRRRQKSFDGAASLGGSSPETGLLSAVVTDKKNNRGMLSSWRKRSGGGGEAYLKSKSESHGGSFVFPSSSDDSCGNGESVKVGRVRSNRYQLGFSQNKSHFWATIYGAFKQVIPGNTTKPKKDGL